MQYIKLSAMNKLICLIRNMKHFLVSDLKYMTLTTISGEKLSLLFPTFILSYQFCLVTSWYIYW